MNGKRTENARARILASNNHSMLGSHPCSVHCLPLRLHRLSEALWWDSRSLRGNSSDLWGLVSSNKISNLEKNAVNNENRIHRRFWVDSVGYHFLRRGLRHLGCGLASTRLSSAVADILHRLLRRTLDCGRLHRIPSREKAELQTLHIEKP